MKNFGTLVNGQAKGSDLYTRTIPRKEDNDVAKKYDQAKNPSPEEWNSLLTEKMSKSGRKSLTKENTRGKEASTARDSIA